MSEPTAIVTAPTTAEIAALHLEKEKIFNGVANLTLTWATVENRLVFLLTTVLGAPPVIVSRMYFSLTSLEARMGMVGAALEALFFRSPAQDAFKVEWGYISNKFAQLKKVRNKVAHGEILSGYYPNHGNRIRLMSPLSNVTPIIQAYRRRHCGELVPSLALGEFRRRSGSLLPGILCHIAINAAGTFVES
jgi:hypothetical protein